MATITEVLDIRHLDEICEKCDILQIGARNMQNFQLLKEVGKRKNPVMLKRGMSATIDEFLLAAEYIISNGNELSLIATKDIRGNYKDARLVGDTVHVISKANVDTYYHLTRYMNRGQKRFKSTPMLPMSP